MRTDLQTLLLPSFLPSLQHQSSDLFLLPSGRSQIPTREHRYDIKPFPPFDEGVSGTGGVGRVGMSKFTEVWHKRQVPSRRKEPATVISLSTVWRCRLGMMNVDENCKTLCFMFRLFFKNILVGTLSYNIKLQWGHNTATVLTTDYDVLYVTVIYLYLYI